MRSTENQFLEELQNKAKNQAILTKGSPIPDWAKPFASIVGLHYWQFLLIISFIVAMTISAASFSIVYSQVVGIGS